MIVTGMEAVHIAEGVDQDLVAILEGVILIIDIQNRIKTNRDVIDPEVVQKNLVAEMIVDTGLEVRVQNAKIRKSFILSERMNP